MQKNIIKDLKFVDVNDEIKRQTFCDWIDSMVCYHCEDTGYYLDGIHEGEPCTLCDSYNNYNQKDL